MIQFDSCHPSLQELCKAKIDLDKLLKGELKNEWLKLVTGLQCVSSFTDAISKKSQRGFLGLFLVVFMGWEMHPAKPID